MIKSKCKIDKYGDKCWYNEHGKFHRENEPAIERIDGSKEWWINGKLHHLEGPAVELINGHKEWWVNGGLHREDGPAIECANGKKLWYYHGKFIKVSSQEEFEKFLRFKIFW